MRAALLASAALALAGCSGGDGEEAGGTTAVRTVTVEERAPTTRGDLPDPDSAGSLADAVQRVLPSVVSIRTTSFGGGKGEASGVVLDRGGLIVTNNHVVEGTTGVTVAFNDDRHRTPLAGDVVGTAPERDLAVIRVAATDLFPIRLARSSALELGDTVIAIGYPLGLGGPTVTSGIVSGLDRTIDGRNGRLTGLLQTDAAINPGNSGGALVDRSGRLVGINTAGVRSEGAENIGFAIAIDEALPVLDRIRTQAPATDAWLGVAYGSVATGAAAVQLGLDASSRGAVVTVVYPGGPGEQAGLAVGDLVVVADDVPIDSAADLSKLLATRKPGDEVDLELIDSRGPRLATVRLVKRR